MVNTIATYWQLSTVLGVLLLAGLKFSFAHLVPEHEYSGYTPHGLLNRFWWFLEDDLRDFWPLLMYWVQFLGGFTLISVPLGHRFGVFHDDGSLWWIVLVSTLIALWANGAQRRNREITKLHKQIWTRDAQLKQATARIDELRQQQTRPKTD